MIWRDEALEDFRKKLGSYTYVTYPREVVFWAMWDKEPLTMGELINACADGGIERSSVYRIVALYEKLGIIKRLQIGWKYKLELSEEFHKSPHHHHLTCLNCGRTIPFDADDSLEKKMKSIAKEHKFMIQEHQLEIQGLCDICRSKHKTRTEMRPGR